MKISKNVLGNLAITVASTIFYFSGLGGTVSVFLAGLSLGSAAVMISIDSIER